MLVSKHSVHSALSAGEVEPPTKFSKRGGADRTSTFRGGCWARKE